MGISGQDLIVNLSIVFWPFFSRICLLLGEFEGRLGFLKQRWPYYLGFPGSSDSKEFSCSAGNTGSIPGSGRSPGEGNGNPFQYYCLPPPQPKRGAQRSIWTSLVAQMVHSLPAMQGTRIQSLGREDLLEKGMATHSSILPGEFNGQRSLVDYSPWSHKESDMTERVSLI